MKKAFLLTLLFFSSTAQAECVILLHGLARTPASMSVLKKNLIKEGFYPVNQGYSSRKYPIDSLADLAITPAIKQCPKGMKINFVTHSLGGILVRQYLKDRKLERLNRVVMLGPPNQGSEVVDRLKRVPGFRLINGHAGMQLGTGENSLPRSLGRANFDVGIIAGKRSINWILSSLIPGADDGKVSIESTKLDGMKDHIVIPVSHPFIMKKKQVVTQVIYYLKNGSFSRATSK